jgi:hypothetical protein
VYGVFLFDPKHALRARDTKAANGLNVVEHKARHITIIQKADENSNLYKRLTFSVKSIILFDPSILCLGNSHRFTRNKPIAQQLRTHCAYLPDFTHGRCVWWRIR